MNFLDRHVAEQAEPLSPATTQFLKGAGGKRWLFKRYRHLFPLQVDHLVDPFVGGGSSFFYLQPKSALLGDLNGDLINLYQAVRDDPRSLTKRLIRYHHAHCKKSYYAV